MIGFEGNNPENRTRTEKNENKGAVVKIDRRDFLKQGALLAGASTIGFFAMPTEQSLRRSSKDSGIDKPNIVYILADDLGWSDISTHPGGTIPTPHVDRLFKEGVQLGNFMGWCVCSPTRAMLLTGRHPFRVGTGPETDGELAKEETTIAEGFKANGYRTGIFGKWHICTTAMKMAS